MSPSESWEAEMRKLLPIVVLVGMGCSDGANGSAAPPLEAGLCGEGGQASEGGPLGGCWNQALPADAASDGNGLETGGTAATDAQVSSSASGNAQTTLDAQVSSGAGGNGQTTDEGGTGGGVTEAGQGGVRVVGDGSMGDTGLSPNLGGDSEADGSASDACAAHPNCDDRNPCTADRCDPVQGCVNEALPDGTACSDGNVCTVGDRCSQAVCNGTRKDSRATLVSSLYSYGGFQEDNPHARGISLVLEGHRIVFADELCGGSVVSLVEATEEGLHLLDQVVSNVNLQMRYASSSAGFWVPNTELFALGKDRFVLAGGAPEYGASVFDIVDDRLVKRSEYLERVAGSAVCTVGAGDRLWRVRTSGLDEFLVSPEGEMTVGKVSAVYVSGRAALSSDGTSMYVASMSGVDQLDMTKDPPQRVDKLWRGRPFVGVAVSDQYLATHEVEAELLSARITAVNVYRIGDLSPVASFTAEDMTQPMAFHLLQDGIVVEWMIPDGATRRIVSRRYDLTGPEPSLLSEHLVWEDCCNGSLLVHPAPLAWRDDLLVLGPWQQVVKLEPGGAQRMLTGMGHGGLTQVAAWGPTLATGFDAFSSQQIDLSDPAAPRFVGGGFFEPRLTHAVQVFQSTSGPTLQVLPSGANLPEGRLSSRPYTSHLSILAAKAGDRPMPQGSVQFDGEPGYLFVQGSDLYQLTTVGNTAYRIRRRDMVGAARSELGRVLSDQVLTVASDDAPPPSMTIASADPHSRIIVIAEQRALLDQTQLTLHWLEELERGFVLRASWSATPDNRVLTGLAVARNRAAVLTSGGDLRVLELHGDTVVLKAYRSVDRQGLTTDNVPSDLLHFDGAHVLVTGRFDQRSKTVGVLDAETLGWLGGYAPRDCQPLTLTEVDNRWLVGSDTGIHVLEPECAAE